MPTTRAAVANATQASTFLATRDRSVEPAAPDGPSIGPTAAATVTSHGDTASGEKGGEVQREEARKQVEFYFSDENLPCDRHMWQLHNKSRENWVPISEITTFKRLKRFQSLGLEWLVAVLRTSASLEVSGDGKSVRRVTAVQELDLDLAFKKAVYANGFGKEVQGLQQSLEKYFSNYGEVAAVRMRREHDTGIFEGSVFTEFRDPESALEFMNATPRPSWEGKDLEIMTKEAYVNMKIAEKGLTGKPEADELKRRYIGHKGFYAFSKKKAPPQAEKDVKEVKKSDTVTFVDFLGRRLPVSKKDGGTVNPDDVPHLPQSTLRVSGFGGGDVSFDNIKRPLSERFSPPFIKFLTGEDAGLVGFHKPLDLNDLEFVKNRIPTLNGKAVKWEFLQEDEEQEFNRERAKRAARRALRNHLAARSRDTCGMRGHNSTQDSRDKQKKRKRAVEPDGGHDVGPIITTASQSKKQKTAILPST